MIEFCHLVEAATDHPNVVLDDALAQLPELLGELSLDPLEQLLLVEPLLLHERRDPEEGAHERGTLHAVAQLGVAGLLRRDVEAVDGVDLEVPLLDLAPGGRRERLPQLLGREAALDHEHAARLEACQRIRVAEDVRVRREHHVDVLQLGVDADRLRRQRGVEGGGLALLLRAVLRVRLDVQARHLEGGHRQVLAGRDRAPAADGVDTDRDRAFRHQVDGARRIESQVRDVGVGVE